MNALHEQKNHEGEYSQRHALHHALEHARHTLHSQGPIGVFVHHNTLHAFQHLPFEEAVVEAAKLFDAEPYLAEQVYQDHRRDGRILDRDIDAILDREVDAVVIDGVLTRRELRRALLIPGVRRVNHGNLQWQIEEGNFLREFRKDLPATSVRALASDHPLRLWNVCTSRYKSTPPVKFIPAPRPAAALMISHAIHLDEIINPIMIRLVSSYLDQGLAYWPMPMRERGFFAATRALFTSTRLIEIPQHLKGLQRQFDALDVENLDTEELIFSLLEEFGIDEEQWENFIAAELLALPGWSGMVKCLEDDPLLAPHERPGFRLLEFLAVRLVITKVALKNIAGNTIDWKKQDVSAEKYHDPLTHQARLFDACQLLGYHSEMLSAFSDADFDSLCRELEICNEWERRRLLHCAYELRHERQILIPLARHHALPKPPQDGDRLDAQVVFCIDEREESIRRAIEEVSPHVETYGAAGFFGCAVDYAGIDDAHGVSLCPVVVKPAHQVAEVAVADDQVYDNRRQLMRRVWAKMVRAGSVGSRTMVRGTVSTACLGFLSLFPMALRILAPRQYSRLMAKLNQFFLPQPRTELQFMRDDEESREATTGLLAGFSIGEMADRVANMLHPMGMTKAHARLIFIVGHGSSSLNNPFVSAYCCGACGGRSGAPNARLFALMANNPKVREQLTARGISLPEDAWFLGGYHDTCSDEIQYFDTDLMPKGHHADWEKLRIIMDEARARSAHERTRRFHSFNNSRSIHAALRHVQERSEHIAEPRPEYGHCTNAVAFVGRRETTKGLFLDRRAFLVSYDARNDPQDRYLTNVLGAVIPVCGGINLEYYFSTVDNERYGCGTKLPHNISGLVGVMNGYQGDLRTGLPLQTVEIHEPVRILFIVETTRERLLGVIHKNPLLTEFLENRWIRLAVMDPANGAISIYRGSHQWEDLTGDEEPLPIAASSIEYYRGKTQHLPLARINPPKSKPA